MKNFTVNRGKKQIFGGIVTRGPRKPASPCTVNFVISFNCVKE